MHFNNWPVQYFKLKAQFMFNAHKKVAPNNHGNNHHLVFTMRDKVSNSIMIGGNYVLI